MRHGVTSFYNIEEDKYNDWGFYLAGIEFSGYHSRESARYAYKNCKRDLFKLLKTYKCSDAQGIYVKLKKQYDK